MMGAAIAHGERIRVLSETEFFDDLAVIDVPVLVMHGEDDQICPFTTTGARSVKLLKQGALISYPGLPHGMPTTHADIINRDLFAFIQGCSPKSKRVASVGRHPFQRAISAPISWRI